METHDEEDGIEPVPNIDTPGCTFAVVIIAASAAVGATLARYIAEWLAQ
jgi:hypothetical protein